METLKDIEEYCKSHPPLFTDEQEETLKSKLPIEIKIELDNIAMCHFIKTTALLKQAFVSTSQELKHAKLLEKKALADEFDSNGGYFQKNTLKYDHPQELLERYGIS